MLISNTKRVSTVNTEVVAESWSFCYSFTLFSMASNNNNNKASVIQWMSTEVKNKGNSGER